MRQVRKLFIGMVLIIGVLSMGIWAIAQEPQKQSDDWLLDANDDPERFKLIFKRSLGIRK